MGIKRLNIMGAKYKGFTVPGIAKKCKDKRVDALRDGWTITAIVKKCKK